MKDRNQVVIIGGGLAGLTAAIHLSKLGFSSTLIDKDSYPRHKVCGEYVSNEVLPYLNWLGIDISTHHPTHISKVHVSTNNGKSIRGILPLGGFGLSRYVLDNILYQKAIDQNVSVVEAQVSGIDFANEIFTVQLADNRIFKSEIVIGAFGKRSNIDIKFQRSFTQKKSPWLAVKGHYSGEFPDDVVGLHNFHGGYCGISKVENNTINLCYLANVDSFKKHKNPEDYQKEVLCRNPNLKSVLDNAIPIFSKPLTISQISFDKKNCVENHVLMIGDTAGLIHPFCGNGMAMAIHSGKIVSEVVVKFLKREIVGREKLEQQYRLQWNSKFRGRLAAGRFLAKLMSNNLLSGWIMNALIKFPSLLPKIIKMTHGKPITISY